MKTNRILRIFSVAIMAIAMCALIVPAASAAEEYDYQPDNQDHLQYTGSSTLWPIYTDSVDDFQALYPSVEMDHEKTGSSDGVNSLLGTFDDDEACDCTPANCSHYPYCPGSVQTDIAGASRELKSTELATGKLVDWPIGKDGVAVAVDDSATMTALLNGHEVITMDQLAAIYEAGAGISTMTWDDVDLLDGSDDWTNDNFVIVPRARDAASGTRATFLELIGVGEADEAATINETGQSRLLTNGDMQSALQSNDYHIGYVGVAYLGGLTNLAVSPNADGSDPVVPDGTTISNGSYPLARNLNMVTLRPTYMPTPKPVIQDYIDFMMSCDGQAVVENSYYQIQSVYDVNQDNSVDVGDLMIEAQANNFGQGATPANPRCDVNDDDDVNVGDLFLTADNFRAPC